jgi:hypothetical protein
MEQGMIKRARCEAFATISKFITLKHKYHLSYCHYGETMKSSVLFSVIIVTGFLLVAGCSMEIPEVI